MHVRIFIPDKCHEMPSSVRGEIPHWQTDVPTDKRNKYNNRFLHIVFDSN